MCSGARQRCPAEVHCAKAGKDELENATQGKVAGCKCLA